ncbi:hypothetical protein [Terricaulis silvestris]|uniref:Uncharacterized protein n=1 Tax=Terricaulis silvestris TaxID=2686094 RepID=A0A6I6MMK8_9CAUL|nr:hypothetical protein [Terricaulis silvestris]QGZ95919.1 hypothetical protein DSM104635_02774 [Terricaulis silvestris]
MPSTIAAKTVKDAKLTEDNKSIVLDLETQSGPTAVTMPATEARKLLTVLLTLVAQSEKALKKNPNVKYPIDTDYWEFATADDGDLVVTFVPPSSAEFSFKLKPTHTPKMAQVLASMVKR